MRVVALVLLSFFISDELTAQDANHDERIAKILSAIKENDEPTWSYNDLASQSDLIVIARLVEKREVAIDLVGSTDFDRESIKRCANRMKILSFLKGKSEENVEVIATEWSPKAMVLGVKSGLAVFRSRLLLPCLSAVEIDGEITDWGIMKGAEGNTVVPEYLLYLKRSKLDGKFVPTTGQRWSRLSIRVLND